MRILSTGYALGILALAACSGEQSPASDGGEPLPAPALGSGDGASLYDPSHVATLALSVSEESLAILRADADQPMNFEDFTYVPAQLTYDGLVFENVGLRVKGNNSRTTAQGDALPFKLDMNRYVDGQKLDGQTKINLHNNVNQPAAMNDYLSYAAFRDYGVAASRTGWADVTLNGSSLGLYTLVEQVNEKMLAAWYDEPTADLYKPESPAGSLEYLGDAIADYTGLGYEADNDTDHATYLKLVKTIAEEPAAAWDTAIDVDSVLTYFAGNVALGNWDTYSAMGHNYYLFEASPGRMVMLPWDMNLSQGATTAVCPADLQFGGGGMGMFPGAPPGGFPGGDRPMGPMGGAPPEGFPNGFPGGGAPGGGFPGSRSAPLHDKLLRDATYFASYRERLQDFTDGAGGVESLESHIAVAAEAFGDRVPATAIVTLRATIAARVAAIQAALGTTTECKMVSAEAD